MATKKRTSPAPTANLQTLKIGSRVRCTDDQAEGRIVWANGVSVKITWNDGEQVTWRRDSLADRPIEILGDEDQPATAASEPSEPAATEPPLEAPTLAQETPRRPPWPPSQPRRRRRPRPKWRRLGRTRWPRRPSRPKR